MSSSVVYILDLKGKVLISRNYRGDLDMGIIDKFMPLVMEREEEGNVSPIIQHGGVTFCFIKYNNLYLVSVTKKNANVAMVFQFLHKVVQVWCFSCLIFANRVAVMKNDWKRCDWKKTVKYLPCKFMVSSKRIAVFRINMYITVACIFPNFKVTLGAVTVHNILWFNRLCHRGRPQSVIVVIFDTFILLVCAFDQFFVLF